MKRLLGLLLLLLTAPVFVFAAEDNAKKNEEQAQEEKSRFSEATNKYHKQFAAWEKDDAANPKAEGGAVFAGSSSITGWKQIPEDFADIRAINRGFGGSTTGQWLSGDGELIDSFIIAYKPAIVVYYCGENDMQGKTTPEQVRDNLKKIIERIHAALPDTKFFYISAKPSPSRIDNWEKFKKGNELCKELTESMPNVFYIDVASGMFDANGEVRTDIFVKDNLHMNRTGYTDVWIPAIKEALAAAEAK